MATSQLISRVHAKTLAELISPTDRQREFFQKIAEFDFVLYEGEASGGKSYALRWWLVDFLVDAYETLGLRDVVVGLFCEDYPTLKDRHISKMRVEFPPWLGNLTRRDGALDFVLKPEYGGGVIALRNLDDPSKYFSAEFAAIAIEELTRHPISVFNDLRFRLRWPGIERPKFGAGTNPGGIGHHWVKKYWITKQHPPEFKGIDKRTGKPYDITGQFARVTAKASDNPYLPAGYRIANLTLPPDMARKMAHGDWDVYTGQYFPHFDITKHVIPHAEAIKRIQKWHVKGLSGDWGYWHPHCFHWHAKDERNCVITYRESWDREIGEAEVGRRITTLNAGDKLNGFAFSWDAGRLSPRSDKGQPKSITQLVSEALGPGIPKPHPCDSSPGVRVIRSRLMSQVLEAGTWLISDACPKLIEAIPTMIRDEDHPEEMLKKDWSETEPGDDPVDSAGMGLQWMIGNSIKPWETMLEERLASVRQTFAGKGEAAAPGEDPFSRFGGKKH